MSRDSQHMMRTAAIAAVLVLWPMAHAAAAPDIILSGARIYTMNAKQPWADVLVIHDGRIAFVGDKRSAKGHAGPDAQIVNLPGAMVLPGFHDSHVHPMSGGMRLLRCQMSGLDDADAQHKAVAACASALVGDNWLIATGWSPAAFGANGPTRALLDAWLPDRPAYLATYEGFSAWVNSAALKAAGIASSAWPKSGVASGDLLTAIRQHMPQPSQGEYRRALKLTSAMLNGFGVTSIIDANVNPAMLDAYDAADAAGELTMRMLAAQHVDTAQGDEQVAEMVALRDAPHGRHVRANSAKLFLDGEIDQHTAAMLAPYSDAPETKGDLFLPQDRLNAIVRRLDAAGFLVHMHAMGDAAVRAGLDAIELAMHENGARNRRHQIAHVGIADEADISRFATLGVAADFQPMWTLESDPVLEPARLAVGPERAARIYPIARAAASGARLTFGSDWPSVSLNPLDGIEAAAAHIPLAAALAAYTLNGAWAADDDALDGSIETGKAADIVVLDRNLFDLAPHDVHKARVLLTLLEGVPVYRDPQVSWPEPSRQKPAHH